MASITPDPDFFLEMRALESAYLESEDPIVRSGFRGGRHRWVAERSPLVDAINRDGTFLDVGCANGLLAEDVVTWAREKGHEIVPHGVDLGARLVDLARERLPEHAANFVAADAWTWAPVRRWTFVYSLLDLSPQELWCEWLHRLHRWVEPGGRLIFGSYGSRSRGEAPVDVTRVLEDCGLEVSGSSAGGQEPVTRFAWATRN